MTELSIDARRRHKMLLMTDDLAWQNVVQQTLPEGWEMTATTDLDSLGDFAQLLLHRFIFLDLDAVSDTFDPQDAIRQIRMDWMLNVPIFCFGGSVDERDLARSNRADRFFERTEATERLLQFCQQFGW